MSKADDLTALRGLAQAATPGPWHFHQDDGTALDISEVCIPRPEEDVDLSIASLLEDRDGAFIAAANPATVLALLDRVERAEAAIERVWEVHQKETRRSGWEVCTHCTVGMLQDPVDWPCDTIAALDTGKETSDDG